MNRRDFLKMGGAGLAGAALLGASGCGGGWGLGRPHLLHGSRRRARHHGKLINKFNKQQKGEFQVTVREMPADTGSYFDKLRTEFQAGGGDIDVIGGDTIWPIQFAAQGWIRTSPTSFPRREQKKFLPAPIQASHLRGQGSTGCRGTRTRDCSTPAADLLEKSRLLCEPPRPGTSSRRWPSRSRRTQGTPNGFVFQGKNYEGGVCNGLEYIWTHGGDVLARNERRRSS